MINNSKYYTKIFNTSPGKFTKREILLIRHFLSQTQSTKKLYGIDKLWKAVNSAPNNIKWILKTFLVANVKSRRAKTLNQVTSTVHGKVYEKNKISLTIENGVLTLVPARKKHRLVMFPDRTGEGVHYFYVAAAIAGKRIPKSSFQKHTVAKKISIDETKKAIRQSEMAIINAELQTFIKFLGKAVISWDPIDNMLENIEAFNDLVYPNMDSLDKLCSGNTFERVYTTARDDGNKLIEEFLYYHDHGVSKTLYKTQRYEFTNLGDVWFTKLNGKKIDSVPEQAVAWVFVMFRPLAKDLLNSFEKLKSRKIRSVDPDWVNETIALIEDYKIELHRFWNYTFDHGDCSDIVTGSEGRDLGSQLVETGKSVIFALKEIQIKIFNTWDTPKVSKATNKDLFEKGTKPSEVTDIDIEEYEKNE